MPGLSLVRLFKAQRVQIRQHATVLVYEESLKRELFSYRVTHCLGTKQKKHQNKFEVFIKNS